MNLFLRVLLLTAMSFPAWALNKTTCDTEVDIAALSPGQWCQVPTSSPHNTLHDERPAGSNPRVMDPWSGGAYDTTRDRFIIWGGGHGDYSGNEVYAFSTTGTLRWTRLNDPSTVSGSESSGVYGDGEPRSIHTYDSLEYVPAPVDRFCTLESAGTYPSGQNSLPAPFCYNFGAAGTSTEWERKASSGRAGYGYGNLSAKDASGNIWTHKTGSSHLSRWNVAADTWTHYPLFQNGNSFPGNLNAAIGLNRFLAVGGGKVYVWDLANPSSPAQEVITAGDKEIVQANSPGLEFDPRTGLFVAWHGGAHVYTLDFGQTPPRWTRRNPPSGPTAIPTPAQGNGTFGRFRLIPSPRNLFIAVNETNESVYFYKLYDDATGALPASGPDTTAPVIQPGRVDVEGPGVYIPWNTDDFTDSQVDYGITPALGQVLRDDFPTTNHSIRLTGLFKARTYYYRIRSRDAAGNETITPVNTFQTPVYLSLTGLDVRENVGNAVLTVHADYAPSQDISMTYQTVAGGTASNGADYTSVSGTLTIPAGQDSTSFSIPILSDAASETTETIRIDLGVTGGSLAQWTEDPETIYIYDDVPVKATLIVPAGPFSPHDSIPLSIQTQNITGISRIEYFEGSNSLGTGNPFTWGNVPRGTFSLRARVTHAGGVTDSLPVSVFISRDVNLTLTGTDVSESAGTAWLTVHAGYVVSQEVTITYQVTGGGTAQSGTDYTGVSGTATIPVGGESASFSIPILGDAVREPDETVMVDLGMAPGSPGEWTYPLGSYPAVLTIHDDETANVSLSVTGAPFSAPASVGFSVQTQNISGVSRVEYFNGATSLGTGASFTWTNVPGGSYSVTARVTHDGGVTASFPVSFSISGSTIPPATALPARPRRLRVR
jgi:hypothetical protein